MAAGGRPPKWVRRLLDAVDIDPDERLSDSDVRSMGIDPARARRYFLKNHGLTFQAYCRSRRLGEALMQIREGTPLDDVALGHGYESHSGFNTAFTKAFGVSPAKGRAADCIVTSFLEPPLGPMIAGATSEGICLAEFNDRRLLEHQFSVLRRHLRCAIVPGTNRHLDQLREEMKQYFAGRLRDFSVPLVTPGSDFQERVWKTLRRIPLGETRSYEALARMASAPGASRAVGRANGMNRVAIVIPCHRIVNKDGKLGGYGGGVWRKQALLDLERRVSAARPKEL
jgi:AraC family transcriptional regulator of adaptative response/methylated-DNA-[protein]-cysteine methyltransferase